MTGKQFELVPLICPHCGEEIGEQSYFQSFEYKVAKWLKGKVAPNSTPAYDVWDCEFFPHFTFQIKYARAYQYHAKNKKYPQITWHWKVKNRYDNQPDFFIFFGIGEDDREYVFLIPNEKFFSYSSEFQGSFNLHVSAKLQGEGKRRNYIPKIWNYVVKDPENNLVKRVKALAKIKENQISFF
jgi:hypothetical protein